MQQPNGREHRAARLSRLAALLCRTASNRRARAGAPQPARGFTLIEILVVVVILGILAGLIVPRIMDRPDQARVVAAKNDINAIMNALKLYRLDNGVYPSADQGLSALVRRPESGDIPRNWKSGGYLERLPKDPWGNDYQYLNPGIHGEVDVLSLGADRQPGGEGYNADVGSWEAEQR
ncbi:MAG: type II secretion system major pseudopilin GspG [Sulfurifustis sp.]